MLITGLDWGINTLRNNLFPIIIFLILILQVIIAVIPASAVDIQHLPADNKQTNWLSDKSGYVSPVQNKDQKNHRMENGIYEPGYIYLFNSSYLGPLPTLVLFNLAAVIDISTLYVKCNNYDNRTYSMKFIAQDLIVGYKFESWDYNATNGCSTDIMLPIGFFQLSAIAYNETNNVIGNYILTEQLFVFLI